MIVGISMPPAWQAAHLRRTNLDLVGDALAKEAGPDDLIIVTQVWFSPAFNYHYHGKTEWNVIPMLPGDSGSRLAYSAHVKKIIATGRILEPVLEKVEKVLRAGHRVWCVSGSDSNFAWVTQFYGFLQDHAIRGRPVSIPVEQRVCDLEKEYVFVVEGWR
jgi:hypothetical protein